MAYNEIPSNVIGYKYNSRIKMKKYVESNSMSNHRFKNYEEVVNIAFVLGYLKNVLKQASLNLHGVMYQ